MRNNISLMAVASAAMIAGMSPAIAQDWPNGPIDFIVAYSAGGGTDADARTLQPYLEEALGVDIVVVNRPGAGGEVGHSALANAEPDGQTMGIFSIPPGITLPITRETDFDVDSFAPLANMVADPSAISVAQDSNFATLEDLISYAQDNPAAVTVATTGVGNDDHFAVLALERAADIDLTPVPFPGSGPARTALIGGHVSAAAVNLGEMMQYQGEVRVLAHLGDERSDLAPDVPTMTERGFDAVGRSERGVVFPAGVDPAIIDKVSTALADIAENPEYQARLKELYTELNFMPPEEYSDHISSLSEHYKTMWEEQPWQ